MWKVFNIEMTYRRFLEPSCDSQVPIALCGQRARADEPGVDFRVRDAIDGSDLQGVLSFGRDSGPAALENLTPQVLTLYIEPFVYPSARFPEVKPKISRYESNTVSSMATAKTMPEVLLLIEAETGCFTIVLVEAKCLLVPDGEPEGLGYLQDRNLPELGCVKSKTDVSHYPPLNLG